jgi:toxin ParE1/3/4
VAVLLAPQARLDVDEIWDYTQARWDAVTRIAENAALGRRCDEIRPGYRRLVVGSHVLFYRSAGRDTAIIRVLHKRMDFNRHSS